MTNPVGGMRARLIWDSVYHLIEGCLSDLGWFDAGRQHSPIAIQPRPVDNVDQVPTNTLTVAPENDITAYSEMGSLLAENTTTFWVDFFAEDDTVGVHLIKDVEDLLEGRFPSIGRTGPSLDVLDYRLATPSHLFYCELDAFEHHHGRTGTMNFRRAWHAVAFDVIDTYNNEND